MNDNLDDNNPPIDGLDTTVEDFNTFEATEIVSPTKVENTNPITDSTTSPDIKQVKVKKFPNPYQIFNDIFETTKYMDILVRAFASYFIVSLYNLSRIDNEFDTLDFPRNVDLPRFGLYFVAIFIMLTAVKTIVKHLNTKLNTDGYFLGTSVMLYALTSVFRHNNVYYAIGIGIVVSICMVFLIGKDYFKEFKTLSNLQTKTIVGIFAIFTTTFIAMFSVYRFLIYASSCFDLGIFSQMYYYLVNTLLPNTTCERNELLSHFAVHVSPIYYILLPIYAIFQSPKTLLICQAILVESGVIPLYLICKHFKFSNAVTLAFSVAYLFSPAYITTCFFDFHENKFLVPLVLWLLWAIETGHIKLMYVFTVLTLFVKEDAFIYVIAISLYVLTSNKKYYDKKEQRERSLRWHSVFITMVGLLYFLIITMLMKKYGLGIMQYHYNNIMMDSDKGITNVVLTSILDPALAISECFTEEKFIFFIEMTLPLMFLPFASKKISHMFLLVPFILVNLISGNVYQNQLGYQYVCGVMSLLFYASVLNLHEMKCTPKKYFATASMCISMVMGTMFGSDKLYYYDVYCNDGFRLSCINKMVALIPEDASVEATTYLVPQLSQRKVIYMMEDPDSASYESTDFVIMYANQDYEDRKLEQLMNNGYEFYNGYESYITIYVKTSYLEEHPELRENQRSSPIQTE